jgi:hypothetical protein
MEIKRRQTLKAFFKDGKPAFILKLNLPFAKGENESFVSRFNAFYEELLDTYILACEGYSKGCEKPERPISFTLDVSQNSQDVSKICVTRTHKLRFPNGEIRRFVALDVFDAETGLTSIEETVFVYEVSSGALASGSLRVGDVFVSATVNGKTVEITRQYHIIDMMLDVRAGDVVTLEIIRGGKEKTVSITITEDCLAEY